MATELRTIPTTEITQTRFFGGQDRGTMLQLTVHDRGSFQSISITREQAARVAQELLLFANGNEVTDFQLETS
mgnify:CR=1 FL=1|tara:strand:- start:3428 stop:3646 length:219 start_codon:yes stop_codon:yes gene_type:complete